MSTTTTPVPVATNAVLWAIWLIVWILVGVAAFVWLLLHIF